MRLLDWFKEKLPTKEAIQQNKSLKFLGKILNKPVLWEMSRASLTKGVAIGMFAAFIPLPMQMVLAAVLAILFSANLPIAVLGVWITNPVTMPIFYYLSYKVGSYFFPVSTDLLEAWKPFLLGTMLLGIIVSAFSAILAYILISIFSKQGRSLK